MKRKIRLVVYSFLVLVLLLWATPALAVPPLPQAFYGTVLLNGSNAVVGTVVSAKINGVNAGSYTTTVAGQYGNVATHDYLAVSCDGANDGDTITFHVNSVEVEGTTATFEVGGGPTVQNLALVITPQSITGKKVVPVPAGQNDYPIDASAEAGTTLTVDTTGPVTVTVKNYYGNPGTGFSGATGKYIDVHIDTTANVTELVIKVYYTSAETTGLLESSLKLRWWNGTSWADCWGPNPGDTGVDINDIIGPPAYGGYMWAKIRNDTSPTLIQLSGTPFAGGGSVAGGGGGGGGGGDTTPPITSDILNSNITETGANIGWRTDEASTSQVEYWSSPSKFSPLDTAMVFNHLVHLTDLTPGTTYHYKTMSKDAASNLAVSDVHTFTTLGKAPAAAFTSSNLSISPSEVDIGGNVTISVTVANTGTASGSYTVTLKIDEAVAGTEEVTLDAGASKEVTFTTAKDVAGTYSVDVNGLIGTFTVAAPAAAPSAPPKAKPFGWIIAGIIAGVVILVVLIFSLRRRGA